MKNKKQIIDFLLENERPFHIHEKDMEYVSVPDNKKATTIKVEGTGYDRMLKVGEELYPLLYKLQLMEVLEKQLKDIDVIFIENIMNMTTEVYYPLISMMEREKKQMIFVANMEGKSLEMNSAISDRIYFV